MHGQSYVNSTVISNLIVADLQDQNPIEIPKLFTREFIPVNHNQIPTQELLAGWKHLRGVSHQVPGYRADLEIGMLIGSNCPAALEPQAVVPSEGDGPFSIRLRHRWTISGPLQVRNQKDPSTIVVNQITIREVC